MAFGGCASLVRVMLAGRSLRWSELVRRFRERGGERFFDIGHEMDPAQLGVMYKCWQHNFKYGIKKFMAKTGRHGSLRRLAFNGLARALGNVPLGAMERYSRRKGVEYERVIETIKARYL